MNKSISQRIVLRPIAQALDAAATVQAATRAATLARVAKPSLVAIWRDTGATFVACAAPILSLVGMATVGAMLVGPVLTVIAVPLLRILVMRVAVRGTLNAKWLRQLPVLLVIAWVYAAAITLGQIGVGVPLRHWGFNLNFAEQASLSWETAAQTVQLRSVDAALLMPDSPFKGWLQGWRNQAFDEWVQKSNDAYGQNLMADYWRSGMDVVAGGMTSMEAQIKAYKTNRSDIPLLCVGGAVLLIVAETLFAFRALMGVPTRQKFRLSFRYFGVVTSHLWSLRLAIIVFKVAFVFAPMVVVERMSYLAHGWGWFGSPTHVVALAVCVAFINALISAFEAVYVARLYLVLERPRSDH